MAFLYFFLLGTTFALLAEANLNIEEEKSKVDMKMQGYYQGDIVVKKTRNGIMPGQRWKDNTIPYEFNTTTYFEWNKTKEDMVLAAMKEIQDHSCIKFRPRQTGDKNYIIIFNGQGCYSSVGMYCCGHQYLSLKEFGCMYHSTIVHELMHAVGLWHEQSRHDRDQHIRIHLHNVEDWAKYNFDQKFPNETDTYGVPYNYRSVMHYDQYSFTKNGHVTIEATDPDMASTIGSVEHGAESDYEKIRRIYECKETYPRMPEARIVPNPGCGNAYGDDYCETYRHECSSQRWAWVGCRKVCGLCSSDGSQVTQAHTDPPVTTGEPIPTVAPPTGECADRVSQEECMSRKEVCHHISMQHWCPKTCGFC